MPGPVYRPARTGPRPRDRKPGTIERTAPHRDDVGRTGAAALDTPPSGHAIVTALSKALVIDDHPLFRDALATAIGLSFPGSTTRGVDSIDAALRVLDEDVDHDIALLDLNLPGVSGFDGLLRLRSHHPRLPVLVVSGFEDDSLVEDALRFGAAGFVPKSLGRDVLGDAIVTVLDGDVYRPPEPRHAGGSSPGGPAHDPSGTRGGPGGSGDPVGGAASELARVAERLRSLTPQQLRVLGMLREGLLNKQIAHELDVGATTVKKHVSEILRKLRVNSRTQAVIEVGKLDNDPRLDAGRRFYADDGSGSGADAGASGRASGEGA